MVALMLYVRHSVGLHNEQSFIPGLALHTEFGQPESVPLLPFPQSAESNDDLTMQERDQAMRGKVLRSIVDVCMPVRCLETN